MGEDSSLQAAGVAAPGCRLSPEGRRGLGGLEEEGVTSRQVINCPSVTLLLLPSSALFGADPISRD